MNSPINPPSLTSIGVTPASFTIPIVSGVQQLTVVGQYSNGLTQNVTLNTGLTYMSSNPAVATISATGLVTAVSNGNATISASYGGYSLTSLATVSNTTSTDQIGQWSSPFDLGIVAVNMVLLKTGKILTYGGVLASGSTARVLDPNTLNYTSVPISSTDLFCSGHSVLSDGRVLVVGGFDPANNIPGVTDANFFDPATQKWTSAPKMAYRRWYPTATTMPDGRVLVTSGATTCFAYRCLADDPEIYNPATNTWTTLNTAANPFWYYPFTFLLPDGRVLLAGSSEQPTLTQTLNVATQTWTTIDPRAVDGGSATMYAPGKLMRSGTSSNGGRPNVPASNATYVLDMTQPSPAWMPTAPMASPRAFHNVTVLPDGSVLATGGQQTMDGSSISNAAYQSELWSPTAQTWSTLAPGQIPRLYHSTALLLPDARVLVAGGGSVYPAPDENSGEIYSPPYLFKGPRPTITSAPSTIQTGVSFTIQTPSVAEVASVALIRPAATTHGFNQEQHFLNLTFQKAGTSLTVQAPANANLAPPGYYMLFLVNTNGVPSIAPFVKLQ